MNSGRLAYGGFMILSLLMFMLGRRLFTPRDKLRNLSRLDRLWISASALFGGTMAAKIPTLVQDGADFLTWESWFADGKTVTAGLAGAYLAVELCKWIRGIHIKTGDGLALPLAMALMIGRFGCLANGCCAGQPTDLPWAIDFGDAIPRHPTQIYESIFHMMWIWILARWQRKNSFPDQRLQLYLMAYCVFRFGMEFIRIEPRLPSGLTIYQWIVLIFGLGLALQWWLERRGKL